MKKIIFFVSFFTTSFISYSQLTLTEADKTIGSFYMGLEEQASLTFKVKAGDTIYTFKYKDPHNVNKTTEDKKKEYLKISFSGEGNALNSLFEIFNSAFESDNIKEYRKNFNLGETSVTLVGGKLIGIKFIRLFIDDLFAIQLNKKELNFLFGKAK